MEVEKLYEMLKKVQEPKGYFFNIDKNRVFELLEALIANKERYGYMACPCRLASPQPPAMTTLSHVNTRQCIQRK